MTKRFPAEVRQVAEDLVAQAGTYLHSVEREINVTCSVCALPVAGYELCPQCRKHAQSSHPLADRVGSLIYAAEYDSQAYRLVQGYKSDKPGPNHSSLMQALLGVGLRGHQDCLMSVSATTTYGWVTVPSTQGRTALSTIVSRLSKSPGSEVKVRYRGAERTRVLRPDDWDVTTTNLPEHILVIDDSWVSGAHSQSVAAALKSAGVEQVSIFTVARVLSPEWKPNEAFTLPPFDLEKCPWTDGPCP